MTHNLLARCAPVAIAASAALFSTPVLAQDATSAEPVIVLPPAATAPAPAPTVAPAPTIVLPSTTVAPEPAEPVAAPVRSTAAERPASTQRNVGARATPRAAPANVEPSVPVANTTTVNSAENIAPVAAAPSSPIENSVQAQPTAEPVAATTSSGTNEALIAGILGALGVAAVGGVTFAASRRRRRTTQYADQPYEPHLNEVADEPVITQAPTIAPRPVVSQNTQAAFATPVVPASSFAYAPPKTATAAATPRTSTPVANGDPVALPADVPQTFEERDALLKKLVAAEPDRANPFTGVRARARRAKLIMQSLNRDFTSRKPRIDLSEYTNRWPALRGWQPATA